MSEVVDALVAQLDRGLALEVTLLPVQLRPLAERLIVGPAARPALLSLGRLMVSLTEQPLPGWRWPEAGEELTALAKVLSSGSYLPALLVRKPERLHLVEQAAASQLANRDALTRQLEQRIAAVMPEDPSQADLDPIAEQIAGFRGDHYVRLAAAEFLDARLEDVCAQLSDLADACVSAAMGAALALNTARYGEPQPVEAPGDPGGGLVAIAMGKYGARELNFCSDIDLVFVYGTDEGTAGERSLHQFYASVCRDAVELLSKPGSDGSSFRVDLRLRPEGSRGPICNALASAERYYETWGGPYDRLAWLKARVAGGDRRVGEAILAIMSPFVFAKTSGSAVIDDIQRLSRRIRAELGARSRLCPGWNVKLGAGGIRDIEFFVQALQLVHAGRQSGLRARSTLRALDQLLFAGLISESEHRALAAAYDLYRRVEHRLQLHAGRQTHDLPDEGSLRRDVAEHLGFTLEAFNADLIARREHVAYIYGTLGSATDSPGDLSRVLTGDLGDERAAALLSEAGFRDGQTAYDQLSLLIDKPWGPFRRHPEARISRFAAHLLDEVADSPDPDACLRHVVDLVLRFGPLDGVWVMLAENEEAARLLCNLFGTSDFLAKLFIGQPELLDQLLGAGRAQAERSAEEMDQRLSQRLGQDSDVERMFGVLERFRNAEVLRIGIHDIAGDLRFKSVWQQLSDVAEQVLRHLYEIIHGEVARRYGSLSTQGDDPARMAVIGLGKLGAREMSYGSDLDLIFIHSGQGRTASASPIEGAEFFARVGQRLIRALTSPFVHGALYQVDARLRPSGSQGTLVSSKSAFIEYHRGAQIWERQVLTRARAVAGDRGLGAELESWIDDYVYGPGPSAAELRSEIVRLRARMEHELAQEDGSFYNVKLGRGGLLDIEFLTQYFQLCFGGEYPALRRQSTEDALDVIGEAGLLDGSQGSELLRAYRFLRRLESRLRIVWGKSTERLPADAAGVEVVARRCGYRGGAGQSAGEQLLHAYREETSAVRSIYAQVFGLPE